jgi:glycosyltransferase involved in cell wall biosynthesis
MTPPTLLCFAGDAWEGNPHSRHHIMRRLAGRWNVLFIEGVPMRSVAPGRGELRRVWAKLGARPGCRTVASGLHVLRPIPVPPAGRIGRVVQLAALARQVSWAQRRLGLAPPYVSWFSVPVAAPLRGRLRERGSVFFYQDRYDAFTNVESAHLRSCIAQLARGCDVSIATANALADDLRALGAAPLVVPHGVDSERFEGEPPTPADLQDVDRPIVGYVGLIDDYVDFDCILETAAAMERGTIVLLGRVNTDVTGLRHPRVKLLGARPYETIPAYLASFDSCLIPFKINRLTVGVNPIKLREYLAAGRPVVSTRLPEALRYGAAMTIAENPASFARGVVGSLHPSQDTPEFRARRRAAVAGESWDAVVAAIEPHLQRLATGTAGDGIEE